MDDEPNDSDVQKTVEGVAGFYDMASRVLTGSDPKTRETAKDLDGRALEEAVRGLSAGVEADPAREVDASDVEVKEPRFVVDDTSEGIEMVIDVGHTEVGPDDVVAHHKENEVAVAASVDGGWSQTLDVTEDGPIEGMDVKVNEEGQTVTVKVGLEGVGEDEDDGRSNVIDVGSGDPDDGDEGE